MNTNPTTKDIWKAARALIENPEVWTQNTLARDKYSHPVPIDSYRATKFCALTAIYVVISRVFDVPRATKQHARLYINAAVAGGPNWSIINDDGSRAYAHPRILKAFDDAIANTP